MYGVSCDVFQLSTTHQSQGYAQLKMVASIMHDENRLCSVCKCIANSHGSGSRSVI